MGIEEGLQTWEEAVVWLRDQPDKQELVRAAFFDDPLIEAAERYAKSTEWCAVRSLLPQTKGDVLDVGAGRGIASYALAKDGWRVTALEPDGSDLVGAGAIRALTVQAGLDVSVVETQGESLPFPDKCFDVIHCRQVLHHADDLIRLCSELARVLRPGGVMVATREHVLSREEDLNAFLGSHPLQALYGGEHAYLLAEYKQAIESAGLKLSHAYNPYESDINLYPLTQKELKRSIAARLHLPEWMVPDLLLTIMGRLNRTPGRLYSFVARKPE